MDKGNRKKEPSIPRRKRAPLRVIGAVIRSRGREHFLLGEPHTHIAACHHDQERKIDVGGKGKKRRARDVARRSREERVPDHSLLEKKVCVTTN